MNTKLLKDVLFPPTPSKLGLYPLYEPQIIVDTTYSTSTKVIQGHDGSKTVAYDDFRDGVVTGIRKAYLQQC